MDTTSSGPNSIPEVHPLSSRARGLPAVRSLLVVVLAIFIAACAGGGSTTIPPDATGSTVPAVTSSPTPAATPEPTAAPAFPVSLTDDEGAVVEIAAEPLRIV